MTTTTPDGWVCPNHPVSHLWTPDKLRCTSCGHTRAAREAALWILSGSRECGGTSAQLLLDALVAEETAALRNRIAGQS